MIRLFVAMTLVACSLLAGCAGDDGSDTGGDSGTHGNVPTGSSEATVAPSETGQACMRGTEGCTCLDDATCDAPLVCNSNLNICEQDLCPPGTETCRCTPEGACDPGLFCASDLCVDGGCTPGTEACACAPEGTCDVGLMCIAGLCVDPM